MPTTEPQQEYILTKQQALAKFETILDVLLDPHSRPSKDHVVEIIKQMLSDLHMPIIPGLDVDRQCAALGKRRKYCDLAKRKIWLPSLAELAQREEGVYPYVNTLKMQLKGEGYPEKVPGRQWTGQAWNLPLEEAFLRGRSISSHPQLI